MQPSDHFQQPPDDLPPLVQRPDNGPLPALISPALLEPVPWVMPAKPRPPHPGFWMAVLWAVVFLLVTNGTFLAVAVAVLIGEVYLVGDKRILDEMARNRDVLMESALFVRAMEWGMAVAQATSVLFGLVMVRLIVGRDWRRQLGLVRPRLVHLVLVLLAAPCMPVVGDLVYGLVRQVVPGWNAAEETMKMVAVWPWWFGVLTIGVGPGVGEELWCRGFLGRGLVGRYGFLGGVLLTSVIFGLLHIDPPHAVAACVMGLMLHYVYLTTRCLWLSMLLHFLNNSVAALAVNNSAKKEMPWLSDLEKHMGQGSLILGATFFLLAAAAWALYVTRTRLTASDGVSPLWQPAFPGVAAPPPGSGTVESIPRFAWLAVVPVLLGMGSVAATVWMQWKP